MQCLTHRNHVTNFNCHFQRYFGNTYQRSVRAGVQILAISIGVECIGLHDDNSAFDGTVVGLRMATVAIHEPNDQYGEQENGCERTYSGDEGVALSL